jgi:hypothetical protein
MLLQVSVKHGGTVNYVDNTLFKIAKVKWLNLNPVQPSAFKLMVISCINISDHEPS